MVLYIQVVFSLVFERIAFGVSPSGLSVVGTCIIIASAIFVALNKPPSESSAPANTESTAMWDLAPSAEEGRGLLAGDERKEAEDDKDPLVDEQDKQSVPRGAHAGDLLKKQGDLEGPMGQEFTSGGSH